MNVQLKKAAPVILVAALAVLLFVIRQCQQVNVTKADSKANTGNTINRDRGFDRRTSYLEYSFHAKCRMQCRRISEAEVEQVMKEGKINYSKSDIRNARCPRYAVETVTADKQRLRIVFAQCNDKTAVVTVIDLDKDWSCNCPGDDEKYDNKN